MQTGLAAFDIVAKLNQVSLDLRSVAREFALPPGEISPEELLRIAKRFSFRATVKRLSFHRLTTHYPLPAIMLLKSGGYGVLLKAHPHEEKALVFIPGEKETSEWDAKQLDEATTGSYMVLRHRKFNPQAQFGFKWFFAEILKFRQVIAEVLMGSFVVQLFGLVTPLFTQVILDKVVVHHSLTTLNVLAVAFVGVAVFEAALNLVRTYIFTHTASKIDAKLGAKLFRHLFALPFVYFESRKVGTIISRVRELDTIREFITQKAVSVIVDLVFSIVFVAMMFLYSVPLTLIVLGFVTVIALLYVLCTPEFRTRLENKFQMSAQSSSYLVESVTGVQTVKSLAIEGSMQRRWEDYLGRYLNSSFRMSTLMNVLSTVSGLLQKGVTIAILFIGVKQVIAHQMTVGQLIAFQMFANQFTGPVLRLVGLWNEFQQALLAVDRIGDILNQPLEVLPEKAVTLPTLTGAIRFESVGFRYAPGSPNVLRDMSFEIQPGMHVGVVGRSGSGKSTLTKLIQRLYVTNEGAIFIDGMDIRHLNASWLRTNIGIVLQENYLFSGTIRENIAISKPDASMDEIIHSAQIAGAHEFITLLSEGYDTEVGERGASLSGGQKQRIAIARALITNPRILIFDEATSALDYESERIIQDNLGRIKQGRTLIVIAHRLSTIQGCDRIFVLEKGHLVENGTHEALMAQDGLYRYLVQQQSGLGRAAHVA